MLRLTFKCNAVTNEHRNDSMTSLLAYMPIKMVREDSRGGSKGDCPFINSNRQPA